MRYRENRFDRVQGEIEAMLMGDGPLTGSFVGEGMSLDGFFIDKGRIELDGTLARHHIVVEASAAMGKLAFRVGGSYRQAWQGELSHFQWATGEYGVWRQEEKAAMTADRDGAVLKKFCLKDGESEVCLDGDVQREKEGETFQQVKPNKQKRRRDCAAGQPRQNRSCGEFPAAEKNACGGDRNDSRNQPQNPVKILFQTGIPSFAQNTLLY